MAIDWSSSVFLLWFNISRQLKPHTAACSHSPGGMGERILKVKVWELTGSDKDSSLHKVKATCTSKAKQEIHSLLLIGRQFFSHFQESRTHHM